MPPAVQVKANCVSLPYSIFVSIIVAVIAATFTASASIYSIKGDIKEIKTGLEQERKRSHSIIKECCTDSAAKNLLNYNY